MTTQLYTLEQASELLTISLRTLRRAIDLGYVAVVRLGRNVRVTQAELTRVAAEGFPST